MVFIRLRAGHVLQSHLYFIVKRVLQNVNSIGGVFFLFIPENCEKKTEKHNSCRLQRTYIL